MIPLTIDIENFLAFGPKQTIDFTGDKLWIIAGENGVGKSTIFDAVTYCLFGEARGSKKEDLIRQGTNGFRLSYTFQLGKDFYRINRNHNGKTPTQSAERGIGADGPWNAVPHTTGAKALDKWLADLLGISYEMYSASIMLEQGKADAIINAKGPKRREILKQILGIDRFEEIWKRVDADRLAAKKRMDESSVKLRNLLPVTADDVALAALMQTNTNAGYVAADAAYTAAAALPSQAGTWERLTTELARLRAELEAGAALLNRRSEIEANAERLTLLERLVPALVARREAVAEAATVAEQLAAAQSRYDADAAAILQLDEEQQDEREQVRAVQRRLDELRATEPECKANRDALQRELAAAESIAALARALAEFPSTLDDEQERDRAALLQVEADEIAARTDETQSRTKRDAAEAQLAKFDSLGGECSVCGQTVTAEHAEKERARLRKATTLHTAELDDARKRLRTASERKQSLRSEIDRRERTLRDRDATEQRLADERKRRARPNDNEAALRGELEQVEARLAEIVVELPALRKQVTDATSKDADTDRTLKSMRGEQDQRNSALNSLRVEHQLRIEQVADAEALLATFPDSPDDEATLAAEWDALRRLPIHEDAEQLATDVAEQERREIRLAEAAQDLAAIPEVARKPRSSVEAEVLARRAERLEADERRKEAEAKHRTMLADHAEYETARANLQTLESEAALRIRLAKLLGPEGLQRELVRTDRKSVV